MRIECWSPEDENCEHKASAGEIRLGPFRVCPPHRLLSYVNDAKLGITTDAIGAEPVDRERHVDRRTACLHQADAFREKALADPEHHDQWIDEAIKWLERAMEASCRAAITVEADKGSRGPEANRTPLIETTVSHRRIIARP